MRDSAVIVIPARMRSARFPGKVLAELAGIPIIQHVVERARRARGFARVLVATEDEAVAEAVRGFGGEVRLTSADCASGTDRVAEVARELDAGILVNVQGDEPLIDPRAIEAATEPLRRHPEVSMASLMAPIDDAVLIADPNVVKVVCDAAGDALYFSRAPIPHRRRGATAQVYKHLGLYVYRRDFLLELSGWEPSPLELSEGLEQLRVLEHGRRIRMVVTDTASPSVDTPEQLERLRARMGEEHE